MLIAAARQTQLDHGVREGLVYDGVLYLMAALLFVGLICNLLIRPVGEQHQMTADELAREEALQRDRAAGGDAETAARGGFGLLGALAWLGVGVPFAIGLLIALQKAAALF
jgi:hypothetical protein